MKADACRYLSEISSCLKEYSKKAYDAYSEATEIANELPDASVIPAALALNFSGIIIILIKCIDLYSILIVLFDKSLILINSACF